MELWGNGELEVVALESTDARSWGLFPYAIKRIADFSRKYDSDAEVAKMVHSLKQAFVLGQGGLILVGLESGRIVGHVLVSVEEWFGTRFATISQYELDRGFPKAATEYGLGYAEEWSKRQGCKFLQALARNERVARAFSVFHGFTKDRIMMRKALSPSTGVAKIEEPA